MERESMVFYRSFYEAIVDLPDVELAQAFRAIAEYGLNGIETECSGTARVALMMAKPQIDKNNKRYLNGIKGGRPTDKTEKEQEELRKLRNSQEYVKWREAVYEKDGCTCVICGAKENLHAHHKKSFDKYPELRFSIENGITVCRTCHLNIHNKKCDNQPITKTTPNVNDNDNVNDIKKKDTKVSKEKAHFVPPTLENVIGYCQEKGLNVDAQRFVDFYESKGWMVGKNKMKDWKAAVRNWSRSDDKTAKKPVQTRFHNFEQRTYASEDLDKLFVNK